MFGKKFMMAVSGLIVLMVGTAQAAKSVFIISKHNSPSQAQAYSIDGDQITYQAQVDIDTYNQDQGLGAVGNAIWPEKELMFVTYEGSPMVVWASTKTLEKVGEFDTVDSKLQAYKIEGVNLVHQADYVCESDFAAGTGAVGLAIDTSDYGDFLFITFENQNEIELVDAKTMKYLDNAGQR